jgi:hypothetical protein
MPLKKREPETKRTGKIAQVIIIHGIYAVWDNKSAWNWGPRQVTIITLVP